MYEQYTVRISSVRQHNEGNVIIGLPAKKSPPPPKRLHLGCAAMSL